MSKLGETVEKDRRKSDFDLICIEESIVLRIPAGILRWPDNALRHSLASYHLADFKNAAATALELGHHDSRVTFAHYRELVRPKEAERYWNIKPETSAKVVPLLAR